MMYVRDHSVAIPMRGDYSEARTLRQNIDSDSWGKRSFFRIVVPCPIASSNR
jgi:hypothetical protein